MKMKINAEENLYFYTSTNYYYFSKNASEILRRFRAP